MIEAFPEDQLFEYRIGTMRPFGELALEMLGMAAPMLRGVVTGQWEAGVRGRVRTRAALLRRWDDSTEDIDILWSQIPPGGFRETMTAFGRYEGKLHDLLLYVIDNEIHHRGQGYTYLRALGVEPPPFHERDP